MHIDQIDTRELLEALNVIVITLDREGRLRSANRYGESFLQAGMIDSVIGKNFITAFIPESDRPFIREHFQSLTNGKADQLHNIVCPITVPDGTVKQVRWDSAVLKDAQGAITGVISSGIDITESHRLQETLQKTALRYQALLDQMPEPAWLIDGETTRFIDVNDASLKLYGFTKEEMLGIHISDIDIFDDEEQVKKNTEIIKKEGFVAFDTKHRTKSGDILDVRVSVRPVFTPGEAPILSVTVHDQTRLKAKERELRELNQQLESKIRKRTKALERATQNLQTAQEIAHVGNWNWNIRTDELEWSDEIYRIFGHDPQSLAATYDAFLAGVHPDDRERVSQSVSLALEGKKGYDVEHRIVRPDGVIKHVREKGIVTCDMEDNPVSMLGVVHDISDYKNVIDQLSSTKKRLELAQHISQMGNWTRHLGNNTVEWSDEVYHIFSRPKEKEHPLFFEDFIHAIHPDDRERVRGEINRYMDEGIDAYGLDYKIKTPQGILKYLHEEVRVIRSGARAIRIEGTVQDVTERVKTEKAIQEYNEILDNYIITSQTDLKGVITHASNAFCKISGYTKEELIGQRHSIIRHPDMPNSLYRELWQTILSGRTWEGEMKNLTKEGGAYWVMSHISPKHDDEGNIIGFTAIRQDITDKKRIEELSITDELTALFNRRYFNKALPQGFQRAKRDSKIFCFFIMDVDHFKRYNDTYGHHRGDEVLKSIAALFHTHFKRSDDAGYRLGGEEFGAIFLAEKSSEALAFTERFKEAIEGLRIPHEKSGISPFVTASIGLLTIDFSQDGKSFIFDATRIYEQADNLLYQAKASGRNSVVASQISL